MGNIDDTRLCIPFFLYKKKNLPDCCLIKFLPAILVLDFADEECLLSSTVRSSFSDMLYVGESVKKSFKSTKTDLHTVIIFSIYNIIPL